MAKKSTQFRIPKMSEKKRYTEGIDFITEAQTVLGKFKQDQKRVFDAKDREPLAVKEYMENLENVVSGIASYQQKYPTFGKEFGHVAESSLKGALIGYGALAALAVPAAVIADLFPQKAPGPSLSYPQVLNGLGLGGATIGACLGVYTGIGNLREDKKQADYAHLAQRFLDTPKEIRYGKPGEV
jgi:hypothetical protein